MALLRVLQQEKYILRNTKLPNRRNVLSAAAKNKEVGGGGKMSQVWLPLVPFYRMKCPLEDSITLKLYCVL